MNVFAEFHFIRPAWLILIPLVIWVWWRLGQLLDPLRGWRSVMDRDLLDAMHVGGSETNRFDRIALLVVWLLGTFAMSGPTWRPEPSPFADDPVPSMVLLSASESMDLSDLSPSRMERARLKVADFAAQRKGQPTGLIAYSGSSHLVLPPTRDTSVVAEMAMEISRQIMPKPGDNLAGALKLAAETLGKAGGTIVVVTDTVRSGQDDQLQSFRRENRIPVTLLAIARDDTPELDAINRAAKSVGGTVTLMTPDSTDVQMLAKKIASTPIAVAETGEGTRWADAGWWLVPVIAALVIAGFRRVETSGKVNLESRTRSRKA